MPCLQRMQLSLFQRYLSGSDIFLMFILFRLGSGCIPVALFQFQVRAAISALQYHRDLPRLPGTISVPDARNSDMLDLLHCVFGFQVWYVSPIPLILHENYSCPNALNLITLFN